MIRVPRPENLADPKWQKWSQKAKEAIEGLIAQYAPGADVVIENKLYQEVKPFLMALFNEKCAYCESIITNTHPGDVEHYRPKGRIRTKSGVLKVEIDGREVEHPGYWWLAYEWNNLLPACNDCNRQRRHGEDILAGKGDRFDVRGKHAFSPNDNLKEEGPFLLDPSVPEFNPHAHFEFEQDGKIKPLSDDASYSCELLGLNEREQLVGLRMQAYVHAERTFRDYITIGVTVTALNLPPESLEPHRKEINAIWGGRSAYSAFARSALLSFRDRWHTKTGALIDLPLPPPSAAAT